MSVCDTRHIQERAESSNTGTFQLLLAFQKQVQQAHTPKNTTYHIHGSNKRTYENIAPSHPQCQLTTRRPGRNPIDTLMEHRDGWHSCNTLAA